METGKLDLTIRKGALFTLDFIYTDNDSNPIDVTGWTAKAQIRKDASASSVYVEMSTANGRIILDGVNGGFTINIPVSVTENIRWKKGKWDLKITSADLTQDYYLLEGDVTVETMVTQ